MNITEINNILKIRKKIQQIIDAGNDISVIQEYLDTEGFTLDSFLNAYKQALAQIAKRKKPRQIKKLPKILAELKPEEWEFKPEIRITPTGRYTGAPTPEPEEVIEELKKIRETYLIPTRKVEEWARETIPPIVFKPSEIAREKIPVPIAKEIVSGLLDPALWLATPFDPEAWLLGLTFGRAMKMATKKPKKKIEKKTKKELYQEVKEKITKMEKMTKIKLREKEFKKIQPTLEKIKDLPEAMMDRKIQQYLRKSRKVQELKEKIEKMKIQEKKVEKERIKQILQIKNEIKQIKEQIKAKKIEKTEGIKKIQEKGDKIKYLREKQKKHREMIQNLIESKKSRIQEIITGRAVRKPKIKVKKVEKPLDKTFIISIPKDDIYVKVPLDWKKEDIAKAIIYAKTVGKKGETVEITTWIDKSIDELVQEYIEQKIILGKKKVTAKKQQEMLKSLKDEINQLLKRHKISTLKSQITRMQKLREEVKEIQVKIPKEEEKIINYFVNIGGIGQFKKTFSIVSSKYPELIEQIPEKFKVKKVTEKTKLIDTLIHDVQKKTGENKEKIISSLIKIFNKKDYQDIIEKRVKIQRLEEILKKFFKDKEIAKLTPKEAVRHIVLTEREKWIKSPFFKQIYEAEKVEFMQRAQRISKNLKVIDDIFAGIATTSPKKLYKELEKLKIEIPDILKQDVERKFAEIRIKKAEDIPKMLERLKKQGVRQEILDTVLIDGRYLAKKYYKVKRTADDKIAITISKGLLKKIKKDFKYKEAREVLDKSYFKDWVKAKKIAIKQGLRYFEVPQEFFRRIGLPFIYNTVRNGERTAEAIATKLKIHIHKMLKNVPKKDRKKIILFFMSQNEIFKKRLIDAGIKPINWDDLTPELKKAVRYWRKMRKPLEKKLFDIVNRYKIEATVKVKDKLVKVPIKQIPDYFPFYVRKDLQFVEAPLYPNARGHITPNHPFWSSLMPRKPDVPIKLYDFNVERVLTLWAEGYARFVGLTPKIAPIRYLMNSKEFQKIIIDEDILNNMKKWLNFVIAPPVPNVWERLLRALRKASVRAFLGGWVMGNLQTILKQPISFLDLAINEAISYKGFRRYFKLAKDLPSIQERIPFLALYDMRGVFDTAFLQGISVVDKLTARTAVGAMFYPRLNKIIAKQGYITQKDLKNVIQEISNDIDLAMGGITPAQRPEAYRGELGKFLLVFTSMINSRFQYYIKKIAKGIQERDAVALAKICTAGFLTTYAELTITRLAFGGYEDIKEFVERMTAAFMGNIPLMGSVFYAWHTNQEFNPVLVFKETTWAMRELKKAFEEDKDMMEKLNHVRRAMWIGAEIYPGIPRAFRRTIESLEYIERGAVYDARGRILYYLDEGDKLRILIGGKYKALTAEEYFEERR